MSENQKKRVIYLIACGTPVAQRLYTLVPLLQAEGWETCVILTPTATRFVDRERLSVLTGYPVCSEYKLALGLLCELTGLKLPILAIPLIRKGGGLDTHPAFARSLRLLKKYGVHVFYEPDLYPPRNEMTDEGILRELRSMLPLP